MLRLHEEQPERWVVNDGGRRGEPKRNGTLCLNIHGTRDLCAVTLLDDNAFPRGNCHVKRTEGSSNKKMKMSQYCQAVSSYFVGNIAVACDAIGTNYDGANAARFKQRSCRTVTEQPDRNAQFFQLPSCQTRALQQRPCFVCIYCERPPLVGARYHAKSGALPSSCQATCGTQFMLSQQECKKWAQGSKDTPCRSISGNV